MQRQFASFKQFLQETAHCQRTGIFFDARLAILNKGRTTFAVVEAVGISAVVCNLQAVSCKQKYAVRKREFCATQTSNLQYL